MSLRFYMNIYLEFLSFVYMLQYGEMFADKWLFPYKLQSVQILIYCRFSGI